MHHLVSYMYINVLEYLEQSARKHPDVLALRDENSAASYAQCFQRAKAIGSYLIHKGLGRAHAPQPIAVLIGRNIDTVIAFWGCVYSGNFYVPIDITMPAARLELMLDTLQPIAVIDASQSTGVQLQEAIKYNEMISHPIDEQALMHMRSRALDIDPLYAIFTSGSTGIPKGVLISHRGVIDLVEQFQTAFAFEPHMVFANQAPFDFDVSVKDIYNAIKHASTVEIIPKKLFVMPAKLVDYLMQRQVNVMIWAVSALRILADFKALSRELKPEGIRYIMFSGEAMPVKTLNYLREQLPGVTYVNLYGPTEITCNCTYYILPDQLVSQTYIPIGKAFANTEVLLVDEQGAVIQTEGVRGEICVCGTCLALGYYRNPEKTQEAFRSHPLISEYPVHMYCTGDIAYYDHNMDLVFASRKDFQIKHMGHRIELGEIEAVLNSCEAIRVACCLFDREAEKIVCFYESDAECTKVLIEHLKRQLPKYMWPNKYIWFEQLPYNKNGKIDRPFLQREWLHAEV